MYIAKAELLNDYRCLKKGLTIEFKGITLLVGDQGTGKSTILESLHRCGSGEKRVINLTLTEKATKNGVQSFYFDTEKHNPRLKDPQYYSTPNGGSTGIGYTSAIQSRFQSHGEVLKTFTVNAIKKAKDCIVLLDEPESALSLRSQFDLVKAVADASERNVQFIISTHCLPLIESVLHVYSVEHLCWMGSREFINNQRTDFVDQRVARAEPPEESTEDIPNTAPQEPGHPDGKGYPSGKVLEDLLSTPVDFASGPRRHRERRSARR